MSVQMRCDHLGCHNEVSHAPRVVVPSRSPFLVDHKPIRMMTTLHYCMIHMGELALADVLNAKMKARFEGFARNRRPIGFKPDFDKAQIQYVRVSTPEYRSFLKAIEVNRHVAL